MVVWPPGWLMISFPNTNPVGQVVPPGSPLSPLSPLGPAGPGSPLRSVIVSVLTGVPFWLIAWAVRNPAPPARTRDSPTISSGSLTAVQSLPERIQPQFALLVQPADQHPYPDPGAEDGADTGQE